MKQSISNTVNQVNRIVAQTKRIVGEFQLNNKVSKIEIDLLRKHVVELYDAISAFEAAAELEKSVTKNAVENSGEQQPKQEMRNEEPVVVKVEEKREEVVTIEEKEAEQVMVEEKPQTEVVVEKAEEVVTEEPQVEKEEPVFKISEEKKETTDGMQYEELVIEDDEEEEETEEVAVDEDVEGEKEEGIVASVAVEEEMVKEETVATDNEVEVVKEVEAEVAKEEPAKKGFAGIFGKTNRPTFTAVPTQTIAEKLANQNATIADKLSTGDGSTLADKPIKDIKSAMTINDKLLLTRELFENSNDRFTRAISILNGFGNKGEALFFLESLKKEMNWDETSEAYGKLKLIVERKVYQ